jgi:hypothetical protein
MSAGFPNPRSWEPEDWELYFKIFMEWLAAENMGEIKELFDMNSKDIISALETFIMGLIYLDKSLTSADELFERRSLFLEAVKGMTKYSEVIKVGRIDIVKLGVSPH